MEQIKSIILNKKEYKFTETAYKNLIKFLNHIKRVYKETGIYSDIEIQLSVLLDMELENTKNDIISPDTVNDVINVLKENRKIKYKERFYSENRFQKSSKKKANYRKNPLRRDSSNNILGGVCSGLARKIGIDPVFIRVFFLIAALFRGFFIPVYIILWIIIPSDKEKITIKKNIRYKI